MKTLQSATVVGSSQREAAEIISLSKELKRTEQERSMYQSKCERGYEVTQNIILRKNIEHSAELASEQTKFRVLSYSYALLNSQRQQGPGDELKASRLQRDQVS